jgi:serine protease AprX
MKRGLSVYIAAAALAASVSLVVSAQQGPPSAAPIRLKAATFTPARGERPDIPPGLVIGGYAAGQRGYFIVQFAGPVMDAWKAQAAAAGAELLDYVPDFAFKARMSPEAANRVAALDSVAWVGVFQPAYKLDPALFRAGAATRAYRVRIERGADVDASVTAIAAAGVQVVERGGNVLEITAAPGRLNAIAHVLDVAEIEPFVLRKKNNEFGGGGIIGAGAANSHGFDGSTQTVAVADTGFGNGSVSNGFADVDPSRVTNIYNWPGAAGGCFSSVSNDGAVDVDSGHGTHTTTSVLGSGNAGGVGRGTAPAAHLVFQAIENWANITSVCKAFYGYQNGYYLTGLPSDLHQLFQQAYTAGARVHSNSWGSDAAGAYTADSANTDDFIWNHRDMTITFSAGNAGVDANGDGVIDAGSMGAPATAKNVISVGASENDRQGHYECDASLTYTNCAAQGAFNTIFTYGAAWPTDYPANPIKNDPSAGNADQMAAFSSRGPASDGRIKPDVVAPGTWVLSGYSDKFQQQYDSSANPQNSAYQYDGWGYPLNRYYKYMGGTSMSNPLVAGGAAVVRDFFSKTYGGMNASAALVKATLVNSAVDMLDENNDGVNDNANPIPNRHEGWGRVDLNSATNGRRQFVDGAASLTTGTNATYTYTIASGSSPFKVTLAWSDPASSTSAVKNLVNDLDLVVIAPGGTQYLGNVFAGGWSQTGGAADRVNNLENVYVASAAAGAWTVVVQGYNVPSGPQPFALVVDGVFGTAAPPGTPSTPDGLAATVVSTTRVDLSWTDSDTEDRFDILRCAGAGCSSFAKIGQSPANVVTYSDISAAPSTTYSYRVQAANTNGLSGYSNTATVTTLTPPPVPIHVGDLDGSTATSKNTWTASVTLTAHNASDGTVQGATASGNWSGGFSGSASCTTGLDGTCKVTTTNLNKSRTSATFTVINVTATGATYVSSSNHDPDNDSTGTTITVNKP